MNENAYIEDEHRIKILSLLYKVLLQWKLILLIACVFAVLGYGYAKYKQHQLLETKALEEQRTDLSVEESQEEEMIDYISVENNTNDILHRYETVLNNERDYLDRSLLMQMDPYHMISALQEFGVHAEGEVDINELSMIGRQLLNTAFDTEILSQIADKYNTDPQYIRELISADERENVYGFGGGQIQDSVVESDRNFASDAGGENYYFYVLVKSNDKEFSADAMHMITEHIRQKSETVSSVEHQLTEFPTIIIESVDSNVIAAQNNARARAFDYSDKFVKLNTILDSIGKAKKTDQVNGAGTIKHISGKKYAVLGFAGGAILIILLLLLKNALSATFQTESDFRSWFKLNNLGTAPIYDYKKIKGIKKRILERLNGPSSKLSPDLFYEMTGTNLVNASSGKRKVLLTGSVDQKDMQHLSEKLTSILKDKSTDTEYVFAHDLLGNPESRAYLQTAEGVVLVEKRNCSKLEEVKEEIEIVTALEKDVLGVILL